MHNSLRTVRLNLLLAIMKTSVAFSAVLTTIIQVELKVDMMSLKKGFISLQGDFLIST